MPEIKIKHVVSFSSEDKVHKAENLIKPETYRQWKCATPGEKNATVVFQFEKATEIHSIDIGNSSSAFVEVLVGRSSDTVSDYQVLLVASSFMSPLESRNDTHNNRVRMFGPEKLSQSTKDEKWDCVQVVCTQPFNPRITYGLSFIKFHSPPEKIEEHPKKSETTITRIGAFKLKKEDEDDDDDSLLNTGSYFEKRKSQDSQSQSSLTDKKTEPSYASVVLASASDSNKISSQNVQKRKNGSSFDEPSVKKPSTTTLNENHIIYKDALWYIPYVPENKKTPDTNNALKKDVPNLKPLENKKTHATTLSNVSDSKKNAATAKSLEDKKMSAALNSPSASNKQGNMYPYVPERKKTPETNNALKKDVPNLKTENKKPPATTLSNVSDSKKNAATAKPSENKKPSATLNSPRPSNKQGNPKDKVPFEKIMDKVVFVLSGFVNPLRSVIRDKALEMGAKYKSDWDSSCTHLICAFVNTPKYQQVKQANGRIVKKEWILDCYKRKKHIPWTKYMLGKSSKDASSSESEESDYTDEPDYSEEESDYSEEESDYSEEEYTDKKKRKRNKQNNAKKVKAADSNKKDKTTPGSNKINLRASSKKDQSSTSSKNVLSVNSSKKDSDSSAEKDSQSSSNQKALSKILQLSTVKDESETEDEEALQDYIADTDPDFDSGEETDKSQSVGRKSQKNGRSPLKKRNASEENSEFSEKPDVTDLPLPELPNLFKERHFFLHGEFLSSNYHDLHRYIIAYNGVVENYMSNKVKYVITEEQWDKQFEDALSENEDLIFVKPTWIYKCHDAGKLLPYQPHIVIPDS